MSRNPFNIGDHVIVVADHDINHYREVLNGRSGQVVAVSNVPHATANGGGWDTKVLFSGDRIPHSQENAVWVRSTFLRPIMSAGRKTARREIRSMRRPELVDLVLRLRDLAYADGCSRLVAELEARGLYPQERG